MAVWREIGAAVWTEPKNSIIKQYIKLFKIDDIELSFDSKALEYIVDKALEFKLGARGLRSICEAIMLDAMFELPSTGESEKSSVVIDLEYARQKLDKSAISQLKVAS